MNDSMIYALDFDGVICDSAVETAVTGWKAAGQIWGGMSGIAPEELVERFRAIRPIIETGYEAILAMRLLHLGESTGAICNGFAEKAQALMQEAQIGVAELKKLFGATRDIWIAEDLPGWIGINPLFDGVPGKLRVLGQSNIWYVVTTKQERFVKLILSANAIELADERIFGLDRNMSKPEVLKELIGKHQDQTLCFVEDRLPTLRNVLQHGELADVKLVFALWGYNTAEEKALAAQYAFELQQLADFLEALQ